MLCIKIFPPEKVNCILEVRGKWQCWHLQMRFLPVNTVEDQIFLIFNYQLLILTCIFNILNIYLLIIKLIFEGQTGYCECSSFQGEGIKQWKQSSCQEAKHVIFRLKLFEIEAYSCAFPLVESSPLLLSQSYFSITIFKSLINMEP